MTDLDTELTRQIHELSKELSTLRERVAVLEYKLWSIPVVPTKSPFEPPYIVTCATGSTGIAGRD